MRAWRMLVALTLLGLAAIAPVPAAASTTGTEHINLTLPSGLDMSGHVTDPNGDPLGDADVGICPDEFDCFTASALTAGDGSYTVLGIVPGTYYVRTAVSGFIDVWVGAGGTSVTDFSQAVTIDISGDVTGIDLQVAQGLTVSGTFTDPQSQPVPDIDISVSGPGSGGVATTDANGAYSISGLLAGSYIMEVRPPAGSLFTTGTVSNGTVTPNFDYGLNLNGDVAGFDVVLVPGRTISGTVTGLTQLADASASGANYQVPIGPDGSFAVSGLWPDQQETLWISHRSEGGFDEQFPLGAYDGTGTLNSDQSLAAQIDVSGGDVDLGSLAAPTLPTVTGTITDDLGSPVQGGWVTLCSNDLGCASSNVAAGGTYAFLNLPNSTYQMYIISGTHLDGYLTAAGGASRDFADALDIVVADSNQVLDAVLLVGLHVSGRVTGTGGVPLAGISVSVFQENTGFSKYAQTDANGDYVVTGLVEGDYKMHAFPDGGDYFPGYWSFGGYVADLDSSDTFHVPSDLTVVIATNPLDLATGVSRSVNPTVTFSADVTNVSTATISLHIQGSTSLVRGMVSYDAVTHTATFSYKGKLRGHTTYVLDVSGVLAQGGAGVPPVSVTFTTRR